MTTETILTEGVATEVEVKPITLLLHADDVKLEVPGRFEINPEGNTLTFFLDRKWRVVTGEDVDHFTANIVQSNSRAMIIQYNWDRSKTPKDYPLVWELVVIAPGLYRWRSPEWPEGQVNSVVGVRCEE